MTLFETNFTIQGAPVDPAFVGTPQTFFDHMLVRMKIMAPTTFYPVLVSDSSPNSNSGFLLLGGTRAYVWDENVAQYVPSDISDSLFVPAANKYVLTSNGGVWSWTSASSFFTFAGLALSNIPSGANGTIAYSSGSVSQWGTPSAAIPDGSVPVAKIAASAADVGKIPIVQVDGSVALGAFSVSLSIGETTAVALPSAGNTVTLTGVIGMKYWKVVYVCITGEHGYSVGDELGIEACTHEYSGGDNTISLTACRTGGNVAVIRGPTATAEFQTYTKTGGATATLTAGSWTVKMYYV
jgi:hypothetical protein